MHDVQCPRAGGWGGRTANAAKAPQGSVGYWYAWGEGPEFGALGASVPGVRAGNPELPSASLPVRQWVGVMGVPLEEASPVVSLGTGGKGFKQSKTGGRFYGGYLGLAAMTAWTG